MQLEKWRVPSSETQQQLADLNHWYVSLSAPQKLKVLMKLVRIQAVWRGYIIRKRFSMIKQIFLNGIEGGCFDSSVDESQLL
jgi:uncharacterized membrane protein